ncbi:unnamed protein product [Adineta ricciae]|uniref:Uncharacterized protein n=1 Tax=Adineta ricciae TaxID=249248 RepID=A0A814FD17_ADIRI|nr:unnamed protein product [Adineta ricciae]CAF1024593.1 unnamed protein product [Adineta ricciae]
MLQSSLLPVYLPSESKTKLEDLIRDLSKIKWEKGEYYFHNFIDYFQLPQIVRVEQVWNTNLTKDQWLYLQNIYDRYLIVASPLTNKQGVHPEKYLIPDWFQGECRILSKNPTLKKRWWVFQGAFELYRFELPRSIKLLCHTPAHIKTGNGEWKKIVLNKNACFNVIRREKYQSRVKKTDKGELSISEPKEAFIIEDPTNHDEFIIPPGVPLRFATLIKDHELHRQYQNHSGSFTFPEILMRYEFPVDIEIQTHLPIDLMNFKAQIKLEKFCVAKTVLAYTLDSDQTQMVELSPLTQFTIRCAKCLTFGLPQQGENSNEKFDEKQYQCYEDVRSKMNSIFNNIAEIYRGKIQPGTDEEVECIEQAYELSVKTWNNGNKPVAQSYLSVDEACKVVKENVKEELPKPEKQPKRFTVHASADPSNPYNEVIDYENMDALNKNNEEQLSKKDENRSKSSLKRSSSLKRQQPPTSKQPALVVQQLPPPMLLPPDSFEKTLKAIPETLYTEFLPATKTKKSSKSNHHEASK